MPEPASHGTATIALDGEVRFEPMAGFVGDDAFEVALADGRGGSDTVRCAVVVRTVPVVSSSGVRIEAEEFDGGGEGVAYHDTDARQGPSQVRTDGSSHDVDIVELDRGTDAPAQAIGYIEDGEWLRYTVTFPTTGRYTVRLRVANGTGATAADAVALHWKDAVVAGPLSVPSTADWDAYATIDAGAVSLSAGTDLLQLDCNASGFDINWIELVPAQAPSFASWIEGYFPNAGGNVAIVGSSADPDGDGLSNILEYGLGRAPDIAERALVPTLWSDTGGKYLALTFRRLLGVTVTAEISDDLVTWSSDAGSLVQIGTATTDASGLYETVTFRSVSSVAAKPRQFVRVRVSGP
ncbi:MAG: carbohydrate-binding protein [Opitutaceae bacterium]|nr:carbohydrate-binding protein [Opitutaceae bacterium]